MKKIVSAILAMGMCFSLAGCQGEKKSDKVTVSRSFVAGYEIGGEEDSERTASCRVLMNLMSNGTTEIYVGTLENGEHNTARYSGTYSLGENEEYDETISFSYTYSEGETSGISDAVIIDDIFEAPFYLLGSVTEGAVKFYETKPAAMDGDVYVGYLTKTGGMGAMAYAYSLCMRENNTFDVSIMQLASVMHVWGGASGTYTVDGENVTFTYDVLSTEGEVVTEDFVSEGKEYTENGISVGFNISQSNMIASDAPFIRVK